jgi:hypothetical protein
LHESTPCLYERSSLKLIKILALIIGSQLFIPISCIGLGAVGTNYIAEHDARYVAKGDKLHSLFRVAVAPATEYPFELIPLSLMPDKQKSDIAYSFLMPKPNDFIGDNTYKITYTVIENRGDEQLIETTHQTDDNKVWSRYLARKADITPISSRMFYFGYALSGIAYALPISIVIFLIGRFLRKKLSVGKTFSKVG